MAQVIGGRENGHQSVVVALRDRLEFMIVTACALQGDAEQSRAKNLYRRFQHGVLISQFIVRIVSALGGPVRGIAQEVGRLQQIADSIAPGAAPVAEAGDVIETLDQHRQIDFGEQVVVQPDGKVLLIDLGWIDVAGRTREELEQMLTEAYAPYYADLTVNVILHKRIGEGSRGSGRLDRSAGGAGASPERIIEVGDTLSVLDPDGDEYCLEPVVQPDGLSTVAEAIFYAVVMIPVSLLPWWLGVASAVYAIAAAALGLVYLAYTIRFARILRTTDAAVSRMLARDLLKVSVIYLPLLLTTLMLCARAAH